MEQGPPGFGQHHVPSPFVTHKELGEVRESVGEIRATQQSIIATYNHLRGDMLNGFDKLAAMLAAERQNDAKRAAQAQPENGFNLTFREGALAAVVLVMTGVVIDNLMFRNGGSVKGAVEMMQP